VINERIKGVRVRGMEGAWITTPWCACRGVAASRAVWKETRARRRRRGLGDAAVGGGGARERKLERSASVRKDANERLGEVVVVVLEKGA